MHETSRRDLRRGLADQPGSKIFRQYYAENDFVLSPEGILKVISAIVCVVCYVVQLSGAGLTCATVHFGGVVSLICACLCTLLYAALVLRVPLHSPQICLYTDIIFSSVMGVLLLVMAVLTLSLCDINSNAGYVLGFLGIFSAGTVTSSAVVTYVSVMRLWDKSVRPRAPSRPPPEEQDV